MASKRNPLSSPLLALFLSLSLPLVAATPPSSSEQPQQEESQQGVRLKVRVDQIRVDVVVTGKKGRAVPGLQAEDFEVYQDGELQQITNLVFIQATRPQEDSDDAARQPPSGPEPIAGIPGPHVALEQHQVRRAYVLVVDDLGRASEKFQRFESIARIRYALIKFIRKQVQPGDLVAIVRTSQAVGALQQFTSDKKHLEATARRLRFKFQPFRGNTSIEASQTLTSLLYIINGLKDLPGRKSVIFLSDGLSLFSQRQELSPNTPTAVGPAIPGTEIFDQGSLGDLPDLGDIPSTSARVALSMQRVVDSATRSFVSVYAIDSRGLMPAGFPAHAPPNNLTGPQIMAQFSASSRELFNSQSGLAYLAQQTGGLFHANNNNLRGAIERALKDQQAYYLLSYQPPPEDEEDSGSKKSRFRRISVKLKRPGLKVRHRAGYLAGGDSDDLLPNLSDPSDSQAVRHRALLEILSSPFASGQVEVKLSSIYFNDPDAGGLVRVLAHVRGKELDFQEELEEGQSRHKAPVDVLILLSDLGGQLIAVQDQTFTLDAWGQSWERLRDEGVIFPQTIPVEKPGGYYLRVAVRDHASGRGGSAAQFVEVPKFRKKQMVLSGMGLVSSKYLEGGLASSEVALLRPSAPDDPEGKEAFAVLASPESPAVRRYAAGDWLAYSLYIYNPRMDRKTRRPKLNSRVILFWEGQEVFRGEPRPVEIGRQKDLRRLWMAGRVGIPEDMEAGEYVLQVVITDELAKQKNAMASQWIDFEVLPSAN